MTQAHETVTRPGISWGQTLAPSVFLAWLLVGAKAVAAYEPPDCGVPDGWAENQRLLWPTYSRVTSRRFTDQHRGLDIETGLGDPVWASANGRIEEVDFDSDGYGHYLISSVTNAQPGMSVLYGHLDQIWVRQDMSVRPGMVLGLAGSSGNSTKPHLHYEVRCFKAAHLWYMDPLNYLEKVWWPEWQGAESTFALAATAAPELVEEPLIQALPTRPLPFGSVIVVFPAAP